MTYHDSYYSEYGEYSKIKEFYLEEVNVARCSHGISLIMKDDGAMKFYNESYRKDKNQDDQSITYYDNGKIEVDCSHLLRDGKMYAARNVGVLEKFLPDSIHFYIANNKWMLSYKPKEDARNVGYASRFHPAEVYELQDDTLILFPDGSVTGAKKITRGKAKIAEDKPLKDHLEPKHFREMAKARLSNDLRIEFDKKYATFRGTPTGLFHYCIELWNQPEQWRGHGPNTGLIRRLYVGRFQDRTEEGKMLDLAVSIVKDIPLSALSSDLKEASELTRGA